MPTTSVVGLDTAKMCSSYTGLIVTEKATFKKRLRRAQLTDFVANLPQCVIRVGSSPGNSSLGLCSGNIWAYRALDCATVCKPYLLSQKNDANDAGGDL